MFPPSQFGMFIMYVFKNPDNYTDRDRSMDISNRKWGQYYGLMTVAI